VSARGVHTKLINCQLYLLRAKQIRWKVETQKYLLNSEMNSTGVQVVLVNLLLLIAGGECISCFNCSSVNDNYCPAEMSHHDEGIVQYVNCAGIYEAQYCVKTTGVNGGSLGTTRFCSSRDVGNYCEYIQRPGDSLEYRSCVYTCSSDGCNDAHGLFISPKILFAISILGLCVFRFLN